MNNKIDDLSDKIGSAKELLKPVIANCTVSAGVKLGEGGALETEFKAAPDLITKRR